MATDFTLPEQDFLRDQGPAEERMLRGGVEGGRLSPDFGVPPERPTQAGAVIEGLVKAAGRVMAPIIKRQEERAFVEGMARAAAGEAARDIAAEKPGWASMFGEDAGVLGARAYEGKADAAKLDMVLAEASAKNPHIAPVEFAQQAQEHLNSLLTGDAVRDDQLRIHALASMPQAFKVHAKSHLAYNQKAAWRARGEAIGSSLRAYGHAQEQARMGMAPLTGEDMEAYKARAVAALSPFPGEDMELRDQQLAQVLSNEFAAGNFHSLALLKEVGVWEGMETKTKDSLIRQYDVEAARRMPGMVSAELMDRLAAIGRDFTLTGEQVDEAVNAMNQAARYETGIDADWLPPRMRSSIREEHERRRDAEDSKRKSAMTAAEKEAEKKLELIRLESTAEAVLTSQAVLDGSVPTGTSAAVRSVVTGYNKAEDTTLARLFAKTRADPKARAAIVGNLGEGKKWGQLQAEIDQVTAFAVWNPQIDVVLATLEAMPKSGDGKGGLAAMYADHEQMETLRLYQMYRNSATAAGKQMSPEEAWGAAKSQRRLTAARGSDRVPAELATEIASTIKDRYTHWWVSGKSGENITDAGAEMMTAVAAMEYRRASGDGEERVGNAVTRAAHRFGVYPGVTYWKPEGQKKDLRDYFGGATTGDLGKVVTAHLRAVGIDPSKIPIMELSEAAPGKAILRGIAPDPKNYDRFVPIVLTHEMIEKALKNPSKLPAPPSGPLQGAETRDVEREFPN